jgi:cardiolipin synthase
MLEAIESAQRSITFETYIYWAGEIGERFAKALSERASAGVEVRVIIDWFGAQGIDPKYLEQMKSAGVEFNLYHDVPWYNPLRWRDLADMEHRTHRKILVVDGKVGFTGGVGIADIWTRKC